MSCCHFRFYIFCYYMQSACEKVLLSGWRKYSLNKASLYAFVRPKFSVFRSFENIIFMFQVHVKYARDANQKVNGNCFKYIVFLETLLLLLVSKIFLKFLHIYNFVSNKLRLSHAKVRYNSYVIYFLRVAVVQLLLINAFQFVDVFVP